MPRFSSFLGLPLLALAAGGLSGCDKTDTAAPSSGPTVCFPAPSSVCFSGVVLADRCWDGVLIQVDAQFPIGQRVAWPDSLGNTNVIAATNTADFNSLNRRGQRIYFTYNTDPTRKATLRACTTDQIPLSVPHLVLGSISGVPCVVPNP
ncbi:hypothetical protein MUN81_20935 [Hymenobacter sp. 5317J-9]|uniref:hypothetical protein n=1 Tax=Hymenobacter sp. 5317J-9 TaxID=2932250 RepID=UPI001FD680AC|nr:hypothetical protein [Hymenobacter sp. 5317J-9]UOQ97681.1 hypothetical protein MUN81_20935 [Hymenobacter sp. 5317J-9]